MISLAFFLASPLPPSSMLRRSPCYYVLYTENKISIDSKFLNKSAPKCCTNMSIQQLQMARIHVGSRPSEATAWTKQSINYCMFTVYRNDQ